MVREAKFSWDSHEPLPPELRRRSWDVDDPEALPDSKPRRRAPRAPRQRPPTSPGTPRKQP